MYHPDACGFLCVPSLVAPQLQVLCDWCNSPKSILLIPVYAHEAEEEGDAFRFPPLQPCPSEPSPVIGGRTLETSWVVWRLGRVLRILVLGMLCSHGGSQLLSRRLTIPKGFMSASLCHRIDFIPSRQLSCIPIPRLQSVGSKDLHYSDALRD